MSKTCMLLYGLFVVLNFNISLGSAKQDVLVLPGIKASWLTPKEQAVDKRDMFYKRNVYDYYQSSDDLPHRERYVYNPYEITRPIFAFKRDKELPTTRTWKTFCKKAGWFCMMKRNNLGTDTSLNQYSKDEFFSKLLGRLFKSQKLVQNNNPTKKNVILVNFQPFWDAVHDYYETNERHTETPMSTANKMKRNGNMIPITKTTNDKKIITRPNEREEYMKRLYYDLFN